MTTLAGHSGSIASIVFSPDGKTLASANRDNTMKLWFAATEEEVEERRWRAY
ncbi:MAG TPA: WD40 repeat domain-containing protein [Pyrinomonadaceae bacterium]